MTLRTSTRVAAILAALVLVSTTAFAQTPPAKARGARDKNASENSIGASNAQVDAAGGTPLKKHPRKARKARKPVAASTASKGGDSGGVPVKP